MASMAPAFCTAAATPLRGASPRRAPPRGTARPAAAAAVAAAAFVSRRASLRAAPAGDAAAGTGVAAPAAPLVMAVPLATVKAAMLVYALLMGGGGVGAYAKTKSSASVISGVGAAAALLAAYGTESVPAALAIAGALTIVFLVRYVKTKKVMPAAALGAVSAAAAVFFGINL